MSELFSQPLEGEFPPVDDRLIAWAESRLGRRLPASYLDLLRRQNGGYLARSVFPTDVKNHSADGYVPVDYLAGISPDEGAYNSILCTDYMEREWGLPPGLVLLCGDGHTWIALDYRDGRPEPGVSFIDVEMEQEIRLADSFAEFLGKLTDEEPEE